MRAPQLRQRPRSATYEKSGTFSYHASSRAQLMHADPGVTTERRKGTRAASTLRNEPSARPGASTMAARLIELKIGRVDGLLDVGRRADRDARVRRHRRSDRHVLDRRQG